MTLADDYKVASEYLDSLQLKLFEKATKILGECVIYAFLSPDGIACFIQVEEIIYPTTEQKTSLKELGFKEVRMYLDDFVEPTDQYIVYFD